ncbi:MAG: hypothetical protein HQK93_04930, partial [Nitrospirae bacterium]|nr:hypothetical protein [Nitrospirota bacterium]
NQPDFNLPIIHLHMHENYGDKDSHLAVFTGPAKDNPYAIIEVLKILIRRNFSGAIIFEQWHEDPTVLINSKEKLRTIIQGLCP